MRHLVEERVARFTSVNSLKVWYHSLLFGVKGKWYCVGVHPPDGKRHSACGFSHAPVQNVSPTLHSATIAWRGYLFDAHNTQIGGGPVTRVPTIAITVFPTTVMPL